MKRLILALTIVALATPLFAVDVFVPLSTTEGLLIQAPGAAKITTTRIPIQSIGVTPTIPTVPGTGEGDRAKRFRDAANAVNEPETAKNLMALYTGMAQRSRPPNPLYTSSAQLEENVREATDIFLMGSSRAAKKKWEVFREVLTAEWVKVAQEGGSLEDHAKILDDAAQGLAVSSNSEGEAFDIGVIFKILEILGNPDLSRWQKVIAILPLIVTLFV